MTSTVAPAAPVEFLAVDGRGTIRVTVFVLLTLAAGAFSPGAFAAEHALVVDETTVNVTGRKRPAIAINGSVPGPILRLHEGEEATLRVTNRLDRPAVFRLVGSTGDSTSIHWHGLIVPPSMDGVPGISFPGIAPGETFTYRFKVGQSGTYWYHSHSGLQEQSGVYGPLVVEPSGDEPYHYDRDYVVMLSDWSDENPYDVLAKLKKQSGYYNFQKRTVVDFFRDAVGQGWLSAIGERLEWGRMRMDPTDLADITGHTYTYLVNGRPPEANWTALYRAGEKVRLRFINAAAMTYFDVRIPGLAMTVVQADGQDVQPVTVDELRIAVAETYDVIVEPKDERAYAIFAETLDRSGFARGTLAPREGLSAPLPARRDRQLRTMADMGMDHTAMGGAAGEAEMSDAQTSGAHGAGHGAAKRGAGTQEKGAPHGPDLHGPGNSMVAMAPRSRLGEAGTGLEDGDRRVLLYTDLRRLEPEAEGREPDREIEIHLTGNMERYMWSFDGKKFSEAEPIQLRFGERVRLTLVNDTMMDHPIHLHGMWMTLDNGAGPYRPRKHTINVKPGEKVSADVDVDAPGAWAFHCHLLYHMKTGMMRRIEVNRLTAATAPETR